MAIKIKLGFGVIGTLITVLLGEFNAFLYALIIFIILDYLTGIMLAIIEKKISSEIGFKGIFKKICIFILVAMGNFVDMTIALDVNLVRTAIIFFYLSNEGISILENVTNIGLPIPKRLKDILLNLNKDE